MQAGFGGLNITSPAEAARETERLAAAGVDQIKAHAGPFETHGLRGGREFDVPVIHQRQDDGEFGGRRQAVFFPDETPQLRERLDCDVEAAVGGGGNFHGGGEDAK